MGSWLTTTCLENQGHQQLPRHSYTLSPSPPCLPLPLPPCGPAVKAMLPIGLEATTFKMPASFRMPTSWLWTTGQVSLWAQLQRAPWGSTGQVVPGTPMDGGSLWSPPGMAGCTHLMTLPTLIPILCPLSARRWHSLHIHSYVLRLDATFPMHVTFECL